MPEWRREIVARAPGQNKYREDRSCVVAVKLTTCFAAIARLFEQTVRRGQFWNWPGLVRRATQFCRLRRENGAERMRHWQHDFTLQGRGTRSRAPLRNWPRTEDCLEQGLRLGVC